MISSFHLVAFLVYEYFMPEWQKNVRDITREIVAEMLEENNYKYSVNFLLKRCTGHIRYGLTAEYPAVHLS